MLLLMLFMFGSVWGSFLGASAYRLMTDSFFFPVFSTCPNCKTRIRPYDNIPLLSFMFLRGMSRCCKKPISIYYFLTELLSVVLVFWVYFKFPFLNEYFTNGHVDKLNFLRFAHGFIFGSILLVASIIDFQLFIIPDELSLGLILTAPIIWWLHPELDWRSGSLGVVIGGGIIVGVAQAYLYIRKQEGIGMGDAKLLAGIGGWLGAQSLLPTLFYGSLAGLCFAAILAIFKKDLHLKTEIPFGPFLSMGAMFFLMRLFPHLF